MSLSSVYAWIEAPLAAGAEIVTASNRLARVLRAAHTEMQVASGNEAWPTPAICDWNSWLRQRLDDVTQQTSVPRHIDRLTASVSWEKYLLDRATDQPLNMQGLVRHSMTAWQLVSDWGLSLDEISSSAMHDDARVFALAARDYQGWLDQRGLADSARLSATLASAARMEPTLLARTIVLCGFDRLVPAVQRIIDAIADAGGNVSLQLPEKREFSVEMAEFDDAESELRAAGAWASRVLMKNPSAQLAVVVPGLDQQANAAATLVREGLVPQWQYGEKSHRDVVNVAHGRRLYDMPAIEIAFVLLRWVVHGVAGKELSLLLRSSFLADGAPAANARAELALRQQPDRTWTWQSLAAASLAAEEGDRVTALTTAADEFASNVDDSSTPAAFAEAVNQFLSRLGWPGSQLPDSETWQLINRWRNLLNEFSRVTGLHSEWSAEEALGLLQSLAAETIWQPETDGGLVDILAPRDTFGMSFDGVWVTGLDASRWPLEGHPSPLLSGRLQRDYGMPDSSPAATLEFSERLLRRLSSSTAQLVLSRAKHEGDGELAPSPLLDRFAPLAAAADMPDPGWSVAGLVATTSTETVVEDKPPPVAHDEMVRGGAYTIQRQHQEPFSAFVQGRLGVRAPEPFREGLSPAMHGRIVHDVLEAIYRHGPSRLEIATWDDKERDDRIGAAIDSVLGQYHNLADTVLRQLLALERTYLRELVAGFLDIELKRQDFRVMATEDARKHEIAGVSFSIRIDRIDQLPDGKVIIIDYKTGDIPSFVSKDGDLRDLQPVVYADAVAQVVGALLFAAVDSRSTRYLGCGDAWRENDTDWSATLSAWRDYLHATVQDFARGDVRIDCGETPGDGRELAILSRIEEVRRGR